jgi:ubiquinone/menaquinone biosynthesis C-methylase UbiE
VRAFRSLGALAIGVDLNPGPSNAQVLVGDFHRLQFADAVFDLAYTNVIGHAFDLSTMGREICRVLKPGGAFLLDARTDKASSADEMRQAALHPESQSIFYTDSSTLVEALGMRLQSELLPDVRLCMCRHHQRPATS